MRQILVRKSADILLKGHGNYGFFKGTPHLITNPPPEAFILWVTLVWVN